MTQLDYPLMALAVLSSYYFVMATLDSPILAHVVGAFIKKEVIYTREDLEMWMIENSPSWLTTLMHCPTCLSFHFGWAMTLLIGVPGVTMPWQQFVLQSVSTATVTNLLYVYLHNKTKKMEETHPQVMDTVPVVEVTGNTEAEEQGPDPEGKVSTYEYLGVTYEQQPGDTKWEIVKKDDNLEKRLSFFTDPAYCKDAYCRALKEEYDAAVKKVEDEAAKDSKSCSPCAMNAIKQKFYKKIRNHEDASSHS